MLSSSLNERGPCPSVLHSLLLVVTADISLNSTVISIAIAQCVLLEIPYFSITVFKMYAKCYGDDSYSELSTVFLFPLLVLMYPSFKLLA